MASRSGVGEIQVASGHSTKKRSKKDKHKTPSTDDLTTKFEGDGMLFKAKLFGTAGVEEARGDEMCQKALQMLKDAVKNTGEHKQKITIKINLDGVTLIDAATHKAIHTHSVNRISFICKDKGDNRSFAYVVGSADGIHTLFGIKTDKPSEGVVLALRDLFQAVYQQKQREESFRRSSRVSMQSESSDHRVSVTSSNPSISQSDLFPPASPALSPTTGVATAGSAMAPSPQQSSHSSRASSRLSGSQLHDHTAHQLQVNNASSVQQTNSPSAGRNRPLSQGSSNTSEPAVFHQDTIQGKTTNEDIGWNIPPEHSPVASPGIKETNTNTTSWTAFGEETETSAAQDPFHGSVWGDSGGSAAPVGESWAAFGDASQKDVKADFEAAFTTAFEAKTETFQKSEPAEEALKQTDLHEPATPAGHVVDTTEATVANTQVKIDSSDFDNFDKSMTGSFSDPFKNDGDIFGDNNAVTDPFSTSNMSTNDPFSDNSPFSASDPFGDVDPFNPLPMQAKDKNPFEETSNLFDVGHTEFDPFSEENNPFDGPNDTENPGTSETNIESADPFANSWFSKPFNTRFSTESIQARKETTFDETMESNYNEQSTSQSEQTNSDVISENTSGKGLRVSAENKDELETLEEKRDFLGYSEDDPEDKRSGEIITGTPTPNKSIELEEAPLTVNSIGEANEQEDYKKETTPKTRQVVNESIKSAEEETCESDSNIKTAKEETSESNSHIKTAEAETMSSKADLLSAEADDNRNSKVPDVVPDAPLAGEESADDLSCDMSSSYRINEAPGDAEEEFEVVEHSDVKSIDIDDHVQDPVKDVQKPENYVDMDITSSIDTSNVNEEKVQDDFDDHKQPAENYSDSVMTSSADSIEPPSCPAPSLPEDVKAADIKPGPPPVPARRPPSNKPPPVPNRTGLSPKISYELKPVWPDNGLNEDVSEEPSMPPPSLPPPTINPPKLPNRPANSNRIPPKIPERR